MHCGGRRAVDGFLARPRANGPRKLTGRTGARSEVIPPWAHTS